MYTIRIDIKHIIYTCIFLQPSIDMDNEEGQEEAASRPMVAEAVTPDRESLAAKTEDERADDTELDKFYY